MDRDAYATTGSQKCHGAEAGETLKAKCPECLKEREVTGEQVGSGYILACGHRVPYSAVTEEKKVKEKGK